MTNTALSFAIKLSLIFGDAVVRLSHKQEPERDGG